MLTLLRGRLEDRLRIMAEGLQARSGLTAAPTSTLAPGKRRSTPEAMPVREAWLPCARSSVFLGILLGKAVPDEVWVCRHSAGECGLVWFWRLYNYLPAGIPLAAINVVWVLVLYFGSKLSLILARLHLTGSSGVQGSAKKLWCMWLMHVLGGKTHFSALSLDSPFIQVLDKKPTLPSASRR